jgi:hypothetical protein
LNLLGALIDLCDLGVTHVPLDRKIHRVAVATEQLDGVGGDPIPTSEAKHFDAEAMNPRLGSPRSPRAAAEYTISRAASIFIAISASMNWTAC